MAESGTKTDNHAKGESSCGEEGVDRNKAIGV
jgi:hypothetical protein